MGYPLSGRGRIRAEAPGVSSLAFIVRLRRLWAGRFLLAFLAILGSSPVLAHADAGLLRAFGSFEYAAPGH